MTRTPDFTRLITEVNINFDAAYGALYLQRHPGWEVAAEELRATLTQMRDIGDVSGLPCPLAFWTSAIGQVRCWLEERPDNRRGLSPTVLQTLKTLSRYASNTLAEAEAPHGVAVR